MKKPQVIGNKVVTRYTDVNSIVLKNYIEISAGRLSKVRAGAHLTSVLKNDAPIQANQAQNIKDIGSEKDLSARNHISSQKSHRDNSSKQVPMSEFMENYISQKNINADLLSTKETNIYGYFKEKFGLMGKYLGEDILKEGLSLKSPSYRGEYNQEKMKKK